MKIHQSTVILLLVICAPLSTYSQTYEAFKNKHVTQDKMTGKDCTAVIENRRINENRECKPINTFIMATEDEIKAVCKDGKPQEDGKTFISNTEFDVIDCTFDIKEGDTCKYKDDVEQQKKPITLTCENGLPVHYGASNKAPKEAAKKDGKKAPKKTPKKPAKKAGKKAPKKPAKKKTG
ncbi:Ribonuclease-like 3 [Anabarilius grahami]|uniref:Ribonuclease-like 3 n=1 Tax=Anabarilius grahami TaxID=495550 RepID=A0A3N0XJ42_ANAGA|nr:Ribonuclease-like 3 [Anabarilius grahami]